MELQANKKGLNSIHKYFYRAKKIAHQLAVPIIPSLITISHSTYSDSLPSGCGPLRIALATHAESMPLADLLGRLLFEEFRINQDVILSDESPVAHLA